MNTYLHTGALTHLSIITQRAGNTETSATRAHRGSASPAWGVVLDNNVRIGSAVSARKDGIDLNSGIAGTTLLEASILR